MGVTKKNREKNEVRKSMRKTDIFLTGFWRWWLQNRFGELPRIGPNLLPTCYLQVTYLRKKKQKTIFAEKIGEVRGKVQCIGWEQANNESQHARGHAARSGFGPKGGYPPNRFWEQKAPKIR